MTGRFQGESLDARLVCFGSDRSQDLAAGILQFTWEEVFRFVFNRYQAFRRAKRQNQQWPSVGRVLWDQSKDRQREAYVNAMLEQFGVAKETSSDRQGV